MADGHCRTTGMMQLVFCNWRRISIVRLQTKWTLTRCAPQLPDVALPLLEVYDYIPILCKQHWPCVNNTLLFALAVNGLQPAAQNTLFTFANNNLNCALPSTDQAFNRPGRLWGKAAVVLSEACILSTTPATQV